jgi:UDP-4-amino-4,6-dideoxy-N-acetyl-beta-L-altrosamine transaminase
MKQQLAIHGGKPVRDTMLSYGKQSIDRDDINAVIATLESDFITQGPAIERFEQAVAEYVGAKYAVAFCNGTAALHGACYAADIGPGDEAVTSPITFLASSNSVLYQQGKPIFADIDKKTYNIDPQSIRAALSGRTKALIPVDFTGQPADLNAIMDLAKERELVVIEDGAHSLGAEYDGKVVGSQADMTMFSFHPVKIITTGEGGIITTNNEQYFRKMQAFRSHGMTKDPNVLHANEGAWYYEMQSLGYNFRMTDLQAALGVSQLKKLPEFLRKRREIAAKYNGAFAALPGLTIPYQSENTNSSWHLYILRWDARQFHGDRKQWFDALRAENIGVHVHYIPVYKQPYYQSIGYEGTHCSEAEALYSEMITIPLYAGMTDEDVAEVIEAVKKVHAFFYK